MIYSFYVTVAILVAAESNKEKDKMKNLRYNPLAHLLLWFGLVVILCAITSLVMSVVIR